MKFDLKELKRLINLVEEANISELSLEDKDGEKVSIKKGGSVCLTKVEGNIHEAQANTALTLPVSTLQPNLELTKEHLSEVSSKTEPVSELISINSPMVGTFYASANPDAPPYVKEGDHIKAGDTVCIVEAMKLFNEIESEISGVVSKILVNNSSPVEYGQPLMLIKQD